MAAHLFHQPEHQWVAVAHPQHRRNAPEKAVQQVDAPAQIELELAVIPEHRAEQQLGDSAAHILVHAAQHRAEGEEITVAFFLILPQQHGSHGQRQTPHHAEGPPHQAGTAHPHPGGQAAEHRLHHITQKCPDDEQPQQVCRAEEVDLPFLHRRGLLPGGFRVGALDALFHIHGNAAAQGVGALFQLLVQLFQHRVLRRIPSHQHRRAQLIQRRNAKRDPYQRMQQPVRHKSTQPQQQPVAPQHSHHAQRTPQYRILQADVAVQVELFIRIVPPFTVVQPLQKLCREPLHHGSREHTGHKQRHGLCTHICKAYCHQDGRGAVDKAERPRRHTAVCKPLAPESGYHGLPYPPKEGIDQIQHTQRVEIQCHRAFLAFSFYVLIVLACAGLHKGRGKMLQLARDFILRTHHSGQTAVCPE